MRVWSGIGVQGSGLSINSKEACIVQDPVPDLHIAFLFLGRRNPGRTYKLLRILRLRFKKVFEEMYPVQAVSWMTAPRF